MAAAPGFPIDENSRFLALLVPYVSRVSGPFGAGVPADGHAANCRVFCRLLQAMDARVRA